MLTIENIILSRYCYYKIKLTAILKNGGGKKMLLYFCKQKREGPDVQIFLSLVVSD